MGGLAVMPWEVEEIADEWLEALTRLADDLPKMQVMLKNQERNREAWLKKQNYRGYLKKR